MSIRWAMVAVSTFALFLTTSCVSLRGEVLRLPVVDNKGQIFAVDRPFDTIPSSIVISRLDESLKLDVEFGKITYHCTTLGMGVRTFSDDSGTYFCLMTGSDFGAGCETRGAIWYLTESGSTMVSEFKPALYGTWFSMDHDGRLVHLSKIETRSNSKPSKWQLRRYRGSYLEEEITFSITVADSVLDRTSFEIPGRFVPLPGNRLLCYFGLSDKLRYWVFDLAGQTVAHYGTISVLEMSLGSIELEEDPMEAQLEGGFQLISNTRDGVRILFPGTKLDPNRQEYKPAYFVLQFDSLGVPVPPGSKAGSLTQSQVEYVDEPYARIVRRVGYTYKDYVVIELGHGGEFSKKAMSIH